MQKCSWLRGVGAVGKASELLQALLMASEVPWGFLLACPRTLEKGSGARRSGLEVGVLPWVVAAPGSSRLAIPKDGLSTKGGLTPWSHLHHLLFLGVESPPHLMLFVGSSMGTMLD